MLLCAVVSFTDQLAASRGRKQKIRCKFKRERREKCSGTAALFYMAHAIETYVKTPIKDGQGDSLHKTQQSKVRLTKNYDVCSGDSSLMQGAGFVCCLLAHAKHLSSGNSDSSSRSRSCCCCSHY